MLKNKEVLYNYAHNTIAHGLVRNDTEEHYTERSECMARYEELNAKKDIAYLFAGYWWQTCDYRVAYAYKA